MAIHDQRRYIANGFSAALCLGLALWTSPAVAIEPGPLCQAAKLKQAGTYASCRLKADAKARRKGLPPDYGNCDGKLIRRWAKAEEKAAGACPIEGDREGIRALVTEQTSEIASQLSGGASARIPADALCEAKKLTAAGNFELCVMSAEARGIRTAEAQSKEKCDSSLGRRWTKAEGQASGSCPTNGDLGAVNETLATQAIELSAAVAGSVCGNGVLEAGEECDADAAGALCAGSSCKSNCQCADVVCCESLAGSIRTACAHPPSAEQCFAEGGNFVGEPGEVCGSGAQCQPPPVFPGDDLCCEGGPLGCVTYNADAVSIIVALDVCHDPAVGGTLYVGGSICQPNGKCSGGSPICTPSCSGAECGDDGCGGSCGICTSPETCDPVSRLCSVSCTPNCVGRQCGNDGCGGSCGVCGIDSVCFEPTGRCVVS